MLGKTFLIILLTDISILKSLSAGSGFLSSISYKSSGHKLRTGDYPLLTVTNLTLNKGSKFSAL